MKMSDVFSKPVRGVTAMENDCGIDEFGLMAEDDNGGYYAIFHHKPQAEAAAHAITLHDELVLELTDAVRMLQSILDDPEVMNVYKCHLDSNDMDHFNAALAKSK